MVGIVDAEPSHPGVAGRIGVLERRNAHEVRCERVDHQVDLLFADLRDVIVVLHHARFHDRRGMIDGIARVAQFLFHLADEGGVLGDELPILRTDGATHFLQLVGDSIQHAA